MASQNRHSIRELAMQALFYMDHIDPEPYDDKQNIDFEEEKNKVSLVQVGHGIVRKRVIEKTKLPANEMKNAAFHTIPDKKKLYEEGIRLFWNNFQDSKEINSFYLMITQGVINALPEIDAEIERFSKNWQINRMSLVDRNILRIAAFELMYCDDIPPKVSINEAIEIGKKFGTEESGSFINGILDSIRISLEETKND
ncbi:Transcription antitermination protein NusB [Candidatus Magnetomoraceae bacterium gMMP-15]